MNRIDQTFTRLRADGHKALVMFISAGDPSLEVSEAVCQAIADAGADLLEIGVPFSDPMADGPTIQAASQRALAAGTTLAKILAMVKRLRARINVPMVLFSYYNVLLQHGLEKVVADAADAGIDGFLVVDVPDEEAGEVRPLLSAYDLRWITLLAPPTPLPRLRRILGASEGFVYYITVSGVTGARHELPADLAERLQQLKQETDLPVVAGFGVSSVAQARAVAEHADGVVIGSALVNILAEAATPADAVRAAADFVAAIALQLHCR